MCCFPVVTHRAANFCLMVCMSAVTVTASLADLSVKFDVANSATLSDTKLVRARVNTGDNDIGVEKVEFYVDDQLKATATSTPYQFNWDTLAETEGTHVLAATAFDAKNRTARAKITITIDNELGKGADYHADAALAAIKEGKVEDAARYARRAVKISPNNLRAAMALAIMHKRNRDYAQALAVLAKAELPENDTEARALLVSLHIDKGEAGESTDEFLKEAGTAIDIYKKMVAIRVVAVKSGGSAAAVAVAKGDVLCEGRDWMAASLAYGKAGDPDTAPMEVTNRLLLSYIEGGRMKEASRLVTQLLRNKKADEVTRALAGLVYFNEHQLSKARDIVQDGVDNKLLPALIVAAYCDLAMQKSHRAAQEVEAAYAIAPNLAEVILLRAYVLPDAQEAHKELIHALEINPTLTEAYTLRGFQSLMSRDKGRFVTADAYFEFALKRDANSPYALMGNILSLLNQKRPQEAESLLNEHR